MSEFGFQASKGAIVIPGVQSVTGVNTDNTDPLNPIVRISVDGTSITGLGTPASPLSANTLGGENYIFVNSNGTTDENGLAFNNAYQLAKTLTPNGLPISSTNQVTIVLAPGIYTCNAIFGGFYLDTQYINVTSLTGQPDVIIDSSSVSSEALYVANNNIKITGIKTLNIISVFTDMGSTFTNCIAGDESFCSVSTGTESSGIYINCIAGNNSFGFISSGTYINCYSGLNSFGGDSSFSIAGRASGYFRDCTAQDGSFGGSLFGYTSAVSSGTFLNCKSGNYSFGYGTFSGVAYNCIALDFSFGYNTNNGSVYYCVSGANSFVVVNGLVFYSKMITGTFSSPTGTGKIILCIDGNNNIQNLG